LPDLLRRVAVLTVLSAVGLALLAPLSARSAGPDAVLAAADPLLAAPPEARGDLARGSLVDRSSTSRLVLATGPQVSDIELIATAALPTPAVAAMEATLYPSSVPAPPSPRLVAAPAVVSAAAPSGDTVTGLATWYCCSLGYRGMAVVALPGTLGGGYDAPPAARSVTVCADRCVVLPVVDYCDCLWGTSGQKVADLSPEAWAAVTDRSLGAGVVTVTVHVEG